jgi:malate dehydrogenase (oxaloacetate-decarboxylating)
VVTDEQLNPYYIVPSVFDPQVTAAVAAAVAAAAADVAPQPPGSSEEGLGEDWPTR